jgi:chondroitin AC lyase
MSGKRNHRSLLSRHTFRVSLLALLAFAESGHGKLNAVSAEDISKLRAQFVAWYTREAPDTRTVQGYVQSLREDGSWPDIDYSNKEPGAWRTAGHLSRILAMAQAYAKAGHPLAGKPELGTAIVRSLGHWTRNDYTNPNWWYNTIGVPQVAAPILILMGEAVPPELREQMIRQVLGRSKMGMTGENKVWLAGIAFMKGLLADDPNLMARAHDQIFGELRVTTQEGVQPDYSFHQHGPQQQWGNYGASFGADMIRWASLFRGTAYAVEPQRLEVLRRYLLEGSTWILWKGRMDISGCGRQIFRNCQSSKGRAILRQLELLATIDPDAADMCAQRIAANRQDGATTLIGHKHFWRSDMTVHRRPTWYASVKMSSTRVIGAETCNGENLLGLHLGDGVTYFYRTGKEYDDLFPVWDWRRLPGTTCRQDQGSLQPNPKACRGRSSFVGGLSDGEHGIAALEYMREGLRARKVWFFLDQAVVCLGAGIDGNEPEMVLTSVNQCALNGPVTICANRHMSELERGAHSLNELEWVHHDGIGYILLEPKAAMVCAQAQTGDWHRVHSRESTRSIERDVFSLWLDHGSRPHDARYAYVVLPDVDASALPSLCGSLPITILQQTASTMAIASQDGKRVQAVFFGPGRLTWGDDSSLDAATPCLVALERTAKTVRLYVADPTQKQKTIELQLSGRYAGPETRYDGSKGQTEVTVRLPQEGFAGQTASLELPVAAEP